MAKRSILLESAFIKRPDGAPLLEPSEEKVIKEIIDACSLTIKPELDSLEKILKEHQIRLKEFFTSKKIVKGKYVTSKGGTLLLSTMAQYEDIDTQAVFQYIMENDLADVFPYIFTVNVTKLKEIVGENVVDTKFRKRKQEDTVRMSFK